MQRKSCACRNDARPESLVVALDQRNHVSVAVDDAQISRIVSNRDFPRSRVAVGFVCVNQLGSLRRPFFRKQRRNWQFLFAWIADVFRKIRIRQLLCFDHGVQRFGRAESPILLPQRKRLHDVQHFQSREALHVGRQLVNRPFAVCRRDGLHEFAGKLGQVLRSHRPIVPLHRFQNLRGNFAFVKCFSAMLCDLLERPHKIRIAEHFAHFRRAVARKISLRCRFIRAQVIHFACPVRGRPFRNWESVLRRSNRRRQILRQLLPSKLVCQFLPAIHRARDGNRIYSLLRHAANSLLLQILDRQSFGRPSARVYPIQLVRLRVINNGEQIAADAVHHRLDHSHHRVRRNRRVHGIPATFENAHTCLGCQRRLRRNNPIPRNNH